MKIRGVTNSVRLRIRKSDVKKLLSENEIIDSIDFPGGQSFKFGIKLNQDRLSVAFKANTLTVLIPESYFIAWSNSDSVDISFEECLESKQVLKILIEKDFPCKHTHDDYEDTYYELEPIEHSMSKHLIN